MPIKDSTNLLYKLDRVLSLFVPFYEIFVIEKEIVFFFVRTKTGSSTGSSKYYPLPSCEILQKFRYEK